MMQRDIMMQMRHDHTSTTNSVHFSGTLMDGWAWGAGQRTSWYVCFHLQL
jgi:hypothetical protein